MLDSIYIGMTGLTGFSRDLSVIGNNVANVNTTGFKSSQLIFSDLFYRFQYSGGGAGDARLDLGSGVDTGPTRRLFTQGELRQSGNDLDAGIDGNGFFVVRRDGRELYTRAGQFSFDADGYLVSEASQARVAALADGALRDISITGLRTSPGKATAKLTFTGILNSASLASAPYTLPNVVVYDVTGTAHTLAVKFTNNSVVTPGSWLVEVSEGADKLLGSGEIRFSTDNGTPSAGFNSIKVTLAPDGVAANDMELNFGDPGSSAGVRSIAAASSDVQLDTQDGYAVGSLTKTTFDDRGFLTLSYSNGQTAKGERLALAAFTYLQGLRPLEGNLFEPSPDQERSLGSPGEGPYGKIAPGQIELSNVELSQEFGNLIISQRGYQASSQVISTANEMIQQLFDIKARR